MASPTLSTNSSTMIYSLMRIPIRCPAGKTHPSPRTVLYFSQYTFPLVKNLPLETIHYSFRNQYYTRIRLFAYRPLLYRESTLYPTGRKNPHGSSYCTLHPEKIQQGFRSCTVNSVALSRVTVTCH